MTADSNNANTNDDSEQTVSIHVSSGVSLHHMEFPWEIELSFDQNTQQKRAVLVNAKIYLKIYQSIEIIVWKFIDRKYCNKEIGMNVCQYVTSTTKLVSQEHDRKKCRRLKMK